MGVVVGGLVVGFGKAAEIAASSLKLPPDRVVPEQINVAIVFSTLLDPEETLIVD